MMDMLTELLFKMVNSDLVARLARTAVQKAGAGLVVHGYMTGNDLETVGGAVAALAVTAFTVIAARKAKPAVPANNTTGGLL
jgi:hypothetical protein